MRNSNYTLYFFSTAKRKQKDVLRIKQANNKTLSPQRPHDILMDVSAERVPFWLLGRLRSTVSMNSLMGTDEGTKQYERFRDTIFLNYWAIVFVKDVEFFSGFFSL